MHVRRPVKLRISGNPRTVPTMELIQENLVKVPRAHEETTELWGVSFDDHVITGPTNLRPNMELPRPSHPTGRRYQGAKARNAMERTAPRSEM
jgi:hypothetical protein